MMRRFKFEADIYRTLECVPMSVRRKLDMVGIKISLDEWQALGRGERLAICHLPAESAEERETLRVFMSEAVRRTSGAEPRNLSEEHRRIANPPAQLPPEVAESARLEGFALTQSLWERLDQDERYALVKLGTGKVSHNLGAALSEFLADKRAA